MNGTVDLGAYEYFSLVCPGHINMSVDGNCSVPAYTNFVIKTAQGTVIDKNNLKPYLGKTLTYEIVAFGGNKCWGTITIEDKLAPVMTSCRDVIIQCYEVSEFLAQTSTTAINKPVVTDNCEIPVLTKTDVSKVTNCGGAITRTWIATDSSGNTAICIQNVTVKREVNFYGAYIGPTEGITIEQPPIFEPQPDGVYCPGDIKLSCEDWKGDLVSSIINGLEVVISIPTTPNNPLNAYVVDESIARIALGAPYFVSNDKYFSLSGLCNLFTTSSDLYIKACPNCPTVDGKDRSFKIIRTWTILDWCTGNLYTCFPQVIKVIDKANPAITPIEPITVTTNPWTCAANLTLPVPVGSDNCDAAPSFTIRNAATTSLVASSRVVNGLAKGEHSFIYYVTDCCGNESTTTLTVNVIDRTPPVPVVKRDIVVSLTANAYDGNGTAKLFASSLDNGSTDNCGPVWYEIRRPKSQPVCENIGDFGHNNNSTFRSGANCGRGVIRVFQVGIDAHCHPLYTSYDCNGILIAGSLSTSSTSIVIPAVTISPSGSVSPATSSTRRQAATNGNNNTCPAWTTTIATNGVAPAYALVRTYTDQPEYSVCDTDNGQFVKFCCADLERTEVDANGDGLINDLDKGWIEVQFRVWDDADMDGVLGECGQDNYNDSWAYVKVECNLPPVITPPADVTVYCDWPIEKNLTTTWIPAKGFNFSKTGGFGWAYGVCGNLTDSIDFRDTQVDGKCAAGVVTRTFRVRNWGFTATATQKITILAREGDWEFYNDWPAKPCQAYYHEYTPDSYKYEGRDGNVYAKNTVMSLQQAPTPTSTIDSLSGDRFSDSTLAGVDPNDSDCLSGWVLARDFGPHGHIDGRPSTFAVALLSFGLQGANRIAPGRCR